MGNRIRQLRQEQDKTQEAFADENYISTSYLALLETGRRTPSIEVLVLIAQSCETTVDYLVHGTPDTTISPLHRRFAQLCNRYPKEKIRKALQLAEYYLKLENS